MFRLTAAAAVLAAALLAFGTPPRALAQATTTTTATVSAPADNSQVEASSHTVGTPPYTYTTFYADVNCSSTHAWKISGANPGQNFAVSYSCTLSANNIQKDQYYNPALGSGQSWTVATANARGEWELSNTLSGLFQPAPSETKYPVTAYTEIGTSTIAGHSASDTNYVKVVYP